MGEFDAIEAYKKYMVDAMIANGLTLDEVNSPSVSTILNSIAETLAMTSGLAEEYHCFDCGGVFYDIDYLCEKCRSL